MVRHAVLVLLAVTFSPLSRACSPPPLRDEAGFVRHHVTHLPKNALGVMFVPLPGTLKPGNFQVLSREDKRRLDVRVRTFKGRGWARLELVQGFQPGASYTFRYLPRHGNWAYPDQMTVRIDESAVSTAGNYAIVPAPRPRHRMIMALNSMGPCIAPYPAVVQEFTYAVPAPLAPYRELLEFDTRSSPAPDLITVADFSTMPPSLYRDGSFSLGLGMRDSYSAVNNAVVSVCGKPLPRIRVDSVVRFPEVDARSYPVSAVEFNLNRDIEGRCSPLDALVQTVDWRAPEQDLRGMCYRHDETPLHRVTLDEWERRLEYFFYMSPTCDLVTLAYLWRTGKYSTTSATIRRLGTALKDGLASGDAATKEAAIHALVYLVAQLPPASRVRMARELLSPAQSWLVEQLASSNPPRPDDIARLIAAGGSLPPALRERVETIAKGGTDAAKAARAMLASGRDDLRTR
jgi:hypothetical protein